MVVATHSPIHPASMVDSASHSPALLAMTELDLSRSLLEYIVDTVVETVDYAMGNASSSRGRSLSRRNGHAKFTQFVTDVIDKAEVRVPALLVTLVYVDRAKPHLQIALEQWANERVFLGALILASKYLNDSTLKNVHWALCTGVFGKRDIGRIEREFLDVLDFELGVTEDDVLSHHASIMSLVHPHRHPRASVHVRSPLHDRQSVSRWSSDSSDVDSVSSAESSSPPRTPELAMDVDPVSYVSPSTKSDPHAISAHQLSAAAAVSSKQESHHQRLSSALNILRSFPLPHFHHYPPQASSSSSSSLASTSSSASTAVSAASQCGRRCKPIAPAQLCPSRATSVFV